MSTHDRGGRRRFPAHAVRTTRSGTYRVNETPKAPPLSRGEAAEAWREALDLTAERLGVTSKVVADQVTDMINEFGTTIDKYGPTLGNVLTTMGLGGLFFMRLTWVTEDLDDGGAVGRALYDTAALLATVLLAGCERPAPMPTVKKETKS